MGTDFLDKESTYSNITNMNGESFCRVGERYRTLARRIEDLEKIYQGVISMAKLDRQTRKHFKDPRGNTVPGFGKDLHIPVVTIPTLVLLP
jgi:hypothetical protein